MLSLLCPPCPSAIVSKLAFSPPEPTYALIEQPLTNINRDENGNLQQDTTSTITATSPTTQQPNSITTTTNDTTTYNTNENLRNLSNNNKPSSVSYKLKLDERAEWQFSTSDLDFFEVFFAKYGRNERIACMYVKACKNPKYTILFSHGNAADLGLMSSFYLGLGNKISCNVFGYDYSGYGLSSGKPSEKNLYTNIEVAWNELRKRYNVQAEKVILYGQSIGTVPTVDLASKYDFAGVVLHSPLTSGLRLAFPNTRRTWFFDAFPNIDKVSKIASPVLVIHGTEDEVIDISHGQAIHSLCRNPVSPLWVEGGGHNDIELFREYLERVKKFINNDLVA